MKLLYCVVLLLLFLGCEMVDTDLSETIVLLLYSLLLLVCEMVSGTLG